ncbi:MAG: MurR/RpiR family transcriptional regulator [Rhodobacterales bacterium]|nr:MurR/RpiR family transcriptional regulator [Rhodobacterales bacterium]
MAEAFPRLGKQARRAAQHVIDRPDDVALMSMRAVAARAGVHPSTMVRLAKTFGFDTYNAFRAPFQARLRGPAGTYLKRARDLQARGADALPEVLGAVYETARENLRATFSANDPAVFETIAAMLSSARRIFVLGHRGSYPLAFHFHYVCRMFGCDVTLLEGRGGTFADELRGLDEGDVLLGISVKPYTRDVLRAMSYARECGVRTIAMTDSRVSPIAWSTDRVLVVGNDSPSFFTSSSAAMAAIEALITLMVARGGDAALSAIEESGRQLDSFDVYIDQVTPAHPRRGAANTEPET